MFSKNVRNESRWLLVALRFATSIGNENMMTKTSFLIISYYFKKFRYK